MNLSVRCFHQFLIICLIILSSASAYQCLSSNSCHRKEILEGKNLNGDNASPYLHCIFAGHKTELENRKIKIIPNNTNKTNICDVPGSARCFSFLIQMTRQGRHFTSTLYLKKWDPRIEHLSEITQLENDGLISSKINLFPLYHNTSFPDKYN